MQSPALAAAAVQARIQARPHAQAARTEGAAYDPPFRLHVQRSLGGDPLAYDPIGDSTIIGAHGTVQLPRDKFCHPEEAEMRWRNGHLSLSDLPGGNGVFLRIQHLVELEPGDEFVVGDQLLRVELNPEIYDDGPTPEPTYFYSSPKPAQSAFRVTQVFEGGRAGSCVMARNNSVQIGAEHCELTLRGDVLVSPQHCLVEEQAGVLILTDLDSRTGVFVRIKGEQELMHGDEVLIGRTRLKLEFLKRAAK